MFYIPCLTRGKDMVNAVYTQFKENYYLKTLPDNCNLENVFVGFSMKYSIKVQRG